MGGADSREWTCPEGLEEDVQGLFLAWDERWEELLEEWRPARMVLDFTSGTKPMSAAAFALAIARRADRVSYITGPRDQTGRAVATTGVRSFAASLVLARQQLHLAAEHFNAGSYAAARDSAGECVEALEGAGEHLHAVARGLRDIAAAYKAWNRFDWKAACAHFHQASRTWDSWTSQHRCEIRDHHHFLRRLAWV